MSDRGRGAARSAGRGGPRGGSQQRGGAGGRGGGHAGGRGGSHQAGSGAGQQQEKKKEVILDLAKFVDKKIRVKFQGGREGESRRSLCGMVES